MTAHASILPSPASTEATFKRIFCTVQDTLFGALAELLHGRDRLDLAAQYDDQESAIEQTVFADMRRCGCRCCGRHLPRLLQADKFDHSERFDGHALVAVRIDATAGELRLASGAVERGRLATSEQARKFGVVGR